MFVSCEGCVLSGKGLCDELITRPEESYLLWWVVLCDLETSWMRRPWPSGGCCAKMQASKQASFTYTNPSFLPVTMQPRWQGQIKKLTRKPSLFQPDGLHLLSDRNCLQKRNWRMGPSTVADTEMFWVANITADHFFFFPVTLKLFGSTGQETSASHWQPSSQQAGRHDIDHKQQALSKVNVTKTTSLFV